MVQRLTDLQTDNWQLARGTHGEAVTELDDLGQCVETIASTRLRSVPLRPTFGNEALDYLDAPLNESGPNIIRGTAEAIAAWEPRVVVDRVIPTPTDTGLEIEIVWHPVNDPTQQRRTTARV